jgi:hypothetical protein
MKYFLLIFSFLGTIALSAQNAPISFIPASETYNDTMQVELLTKNFNGIRSLNLQMNYDTTVADAILISEAPALGGSYNVNINQLGTIVIGWYTSNAVSLPDSSLLFTIQFSKRANGNLALTWYDNGYSCTFSDAAYNTLNDLPTDIFYLSSNNRFLSSAPPAPATPINGASVICPGDQSLYTVDTIQGATGYNWTVPANSTIIAGNNTPQITLQSNNNFNGGILTVAGTNTNGQGTASPAFAISIPQSPVILIQPANDTVIAAANDTAVFTTVLTLQATQYAWQEFTNDWHTLTNNTQYSGTGTPELLIHNATTEMSGNRYRCIFTNQCGNTFATNGEATLLVNVLSSTHQTPVELKAMVGPNPFTTHIQINLVVPASTALSYSVINMSGYQVMNQQFNLQAGNNNVTLNLPRATKGVYLLRLTTLFGTQTVKMVQGTASN